MFRKLFLPFDMALILWQACMWLAGNPIEAIRLYHEAVAEIMELLAP